jgi:CRISPR-associated endoribonuclease Cas6
MRVRIIFILKNKGAYLPFHHQYLLAQMSENLWSGSDYKNFSDFTFSGLKGQTKVSKHGLHYYSSRTTLVVSSFNTGFINAFISAVFEQPLIQLGNLELIPEAVERELPLPQEDPFRCVSLSPIALVSPFVHAINAKKFVPPDVDTFSDLLYETVMARMEQSGMFKAEQLASFYRFQVAPDKEYLKKIKETEKKFARIYPVFEADGKKAEVRGYTFPFTLYAAPEVKQFVFESGLGALTHKGFGMLDIVQADHQRKTEPYIISVPQLISTHKQQNGSNGYHYA